MANFNYLESINESSKSKIEREFFRFAIRINEFPDSYPESYKSTHAEGFLCGFQRPLTNDIIVSFCPFATLDDKSFPYLPWFKGIYIVVPFDSSVDFCLEEFGFCYPFTRIYENIFNYVLPTSTSI